MADELNIGEEGQGSPPVEQQQTQPTIEQIQSAKAEAEARIQELSRRNKELEKIANMNMRLNNVEQQQAAAQRGAQEPEQLGEWGEWLEPKMQPVLKKVLAPYERAFMSMADQIDLTKTMTKFPEYQSEEVQHQVEQIRQQRYQQTGQLEPRENVLIFLRGQNVDKIAEEKAAKLAEKREGKSSVGAAHIEDGSANVAPVTRAAKGPTRSFADLPLEEKEKFLAEHQIKF